jgi:hypothetical protein
MALAAGEASNHVEFNYRCSAQETENRRGPAVEAAAVKSLLKGASELLTPGPRRLKQALFLFLDDDARRNHHQQALRCAADADVPEEAVNVRHFTEDRHAELRSALL